MIARLRSAHLAVVIALIVACAPLAGCGGTNPNTTPQARYAHYGTSVTDAVGAVQKFVNNTTDAGAMSVDIGRKLTDVNAMLLEKARAFSAALKVSPPPPFISIGSGPTKGGSSMHRTSGAIPPGLSTAASWT